MAEAESSEAAAPPEKLWVLATWLLGHAVVDARRFVAQSFGSSNGHTDFAVLAGLAQYGAIGQANLGRRLGINLGDLVAILKRLETEGSVVRKQDRQDRRRNTVEITPAGQVRLSELETAASAAQDELLEPLSPSERSELVALLQRLVGHHRDYQRAGDGATPNERRP